MSLAGSQATPFAGSMLLDTVSIPMHDGCPPPPVPVVPPLTAVPPAVTPPPAAPPPPADPPAPAAPAPHPRPSGQGHEPLSLAQSRVRVPLPSGAWQTQKPVLPAPVESR